MTYQSVQLILQERIQLRVECAPCYQRSPIIDCSCIISVIKFTTSLHRINFWLSFQSGMLSGNSIAKLLENYGANRVFRSIGLHA